MRFFTAEISKCLVSHNTARHCAAVPHCQWQCRAVQGFLARGKHCGSHGVHPSRASFTNGVLCSRPSVL